ncbi:MAG: glutamine amidotransferase, partial [Planctomycetota bacterium]
FAPTGYQTDLPSGLQAAIRAAAGRPLAGVILIGDGTQTAENRDGGAQRAARSLAAMGVPLWTVPIGPPPQSQRMRDVEVRGLPESYKVFAGNSFQVETNIRAIGLASTEIPIRIRLLPIADEANAAVSGTDTVNGLREVAVRTIVPGSADDSRRVSISVDAPPPGSYRLQVIADNQDGELLTLNNRQVAFLDVRDGGGRILYVEGETRFEQTFLRRAVDGFPDLEMESKWIPRDTQRLWPVSLGDALKGQAHDIYILGDLDSNALGPAQLTRIREAVAEGAGLLMLGGLQSFDVGGYANSPLADAIPLQMDPRRRRTPSSTSSGTAGMSREELPGPIVPRLLRSHPITNLGGSTPQLRQEAWDRLPPQRGAYQFTAPKTSVGVNVLLETLDKQPLLVTGEFGRGRVAAFGFDSTWQWWLAGEDAAHRRFWRQTLLWLMNREDDSDSQIMLRMSSRRFESKDPARVTAGIRGITQSDVVLPGIVVQLISPDGNSRTILKTDQVKESVLLPENLAPGVYRLRATVDASSAAATNSDSRPSTVQMEFQVLRRDLERQRPMADPVAMRQLAQLTQSSGGRVFRPEEIGELVQLIESKRRDTMAPVIRRYRLGDDPATAWILFTLFACALCSEWFLRRRWDMA